MDKIMRWFFVIFSSALIFYLLFFQIFSIPTPEVAAESENSSNSTSLPSLNISLSDISLNDLNSSSKDTAFSGNNLSITNSSNTYSFTNVAIRLRGNATFSLPKKAYQIKFPSKTSLFGLGPSKAWVLFANQYDPTHLRNHLAAVLSELVGFEYSPLGEYVELSIDNEYIGLYYLTPKITTSALRLKDDSAIIVELDGRISTESYNTSTDSYGSKYRIQSSNLSTETENSALLDNFISKLNAAEAFIDAGDYQSAASILDMESFAKYLLISELTSNSDSYLYSCYFYMTSSDSKIFAGPVWDFDVAFGNYQYDLNSSVNNPTFIRPDSSEYWYEQIYYTLSRLPEFRTLVKTIYNDTIRNSKTAIFAELEAAATKIQSSAEINNAKWYSEPFPSYTFDTTHPSWTLFESEVSKLRTWLHSRLSFLDEYF